ncbi:hypothetical protein [Desulfosporosinus sp. OT]|uniref:hypothetical protein n=1 Tax=Desulfosporosinus sp. OT TaxID=913865 RepID=UPI0002FC360E|nr:hypothetical protein [Desulfosporosinus sp. OT]
MLDQEAILAVPTLFMVDIRTTGKGMIGPLFWGFKIIIYHPFNNRYFQGGKHFSKVPAL